MKSMRWFDQENVKSIRERWDNKKWLSELKSMLKWSGHVDRISEERLTKWIYFSEVEGTRRR